MIRSYAEIRVRCRTTIDGCWFWEGTKTTLGYGHARFESPRPEYIHRAMYELVVGPIPDGLEIDHLCRVPSCCNPEHLEAVTHAENMRRGAAARGPVTQCKRGHPLIEHRVDFYVMGAKRRCKRCHDAACAAYKARKRSQVEAS